MIHIIILSVWLSLMVIGLYLAMQTIKAHKYTSVRSRGSRQHKKASKPDINRQHKKTSKPNINKSDSAGPWLKLLEVVQFDISTAERLVANCQHRYPDKSTLWCIEKTLWDLERDRN